MGEEELNKNSGEAVIDWRGSSEATAQARRLLHRQGMSRYISEADLIAEAQFAVWKRMQAAAPLVLDSAAAYATTVLKNKINKLNSGHRDQPLDGLEEALGADDPDLELIVLQDSLRSAATAAAKQGDELRVLIEQASIAKPWVTSGHSAISPCSWIQMPHRATHPHQKQAPSLIRPDVGRHCG